MLNEACATQSFTLWDHRIAAKGCMLTTRAAKWVVKEIGSGQTVTHLAQGTGLQLGQRERRHAHLRRGPARRPTPSA